MAMDLSADQQLTFRDALVLAAADAAPNECEVLERTIDEAVATGRYWIIPFALFVGGAFSWARTAARAAISRGGADAGFRSMMWPRFQRS